MVNWSVKCIDTSVELAHNPIVGRTGRTQTRAGGKTMAERDRSQYRAARKLAKLAMQEARYVEFGSRCRGDILGQNCPCREHWNELTYRDVDWHHVDPASKRLAISDALTNDTNPDLFKAELAKCIPVCAICHNRYERSIK